MYFLVYFQKDGLAISTTWKTFSDPVIPHQGTYPRAVHTCSEMCAAIPLATQGPNEGSSTTLLNAGCAQMNTKGLCELT